MATAQVSNHTLKRAGHVLHSRQRARLISFLILLEFLGAVLCGIALFMIGLVEPSSMLALPALLLYLWALTIYFRIDARAFVLIAPLTITTASSVAALVLIEQGVKIPELGQFGSPGNYTLNFVFYDLLFMLAYLATYRALTGKTRHLVKQISTRLRMSAIFNVALSPMVVVMALACVAALILLGLTRGFPLLTGTDRFVFRRSLGGGPLLYILNFKSILAFMLGFVAQISGKSRTWVFCCAIMIFTTLVYFLFGDKFFTILTALALFMTPWLYANYLQLGRRLPMIIAVMVLAAAPSCAVTWLIYSNAGRLSTFETLNKLSGRIVGQGELWYAQSRVGAPAFDWNESLVDRNIQALSEKDADFYALEASLGPNYFSDRFAPGNIALSIHHNAGSVTYTGALDPMGLVMFGWVGLGFVKIFCGFIAALITRYIAWALDNRSIISSVLSIYIFTQMLYTFRQGTPWVLFSIFSFKWLCVIAAIEVIMTIFVLTQNNRQEFSVARK